MGTDRVDGQRSPPPTIPDPGTTEGASKTGAAKPSQPTVLDNLERSEASITRLHIKMFGFADEPIPPPPRQSTLSAQKEADAQYILDRASRLSKMIDDISKAINAQRAAGPQIDPTGDATQTSRDAPVQEEPNAMAASLRKYFGGNFVAAINIAFSDLTRVLSDLSRVEADNAKLLRKSARENMYDEADAIKQSAEERADMAWNQAWCKVAGASIQFGLAVGAIGVGAAAPAGGGVKALETYDTISRPLGGAASGYSDAASSFWQSYYERRIGVQDARKSVDDNLGRSLDAARDSSLKTVNDTHSQVGDIWRDVPQMIKKAQYDISMQQH